MTPTERNAKPICLNRPQSETLVQLGPRRTIVMPWGRGVGKTYFILMAIRLLVDSFDGKLCHPKSESPGVRITFVMDTIEHFRKLYRRPLIAANDSLWASLGGKLNKTTLEIEWPGGSCFSPFPALESTADKARGQRTDVMLADECDDIPITVWNAVVSPLFSQRVSYKLKIVGGTPKKGRAGLLYTFHRRGLDPSFPDYFTRHATYADAPETVDREEVEKARRETPPRVFAREWECDFDAAEGLVFDLFDESFHVRPCPTGKPTRVVCGLDWGYADPGVLLEIGIWGHGEDASAHVLSEVYEPSQVLDWWCQKVDAVHRRWSDASVPVQWFADPSQPANIKQINDRCLVRLVGAQNKIDDGVSCVADKLWIRGNVDPKTGKDDRWARLYVAPECANVRREFGLYKRAKDHANPDSYTDAIVDRDNHAMDALRYAMMGAFGAPARVRHDWGGAA